MPGISENDSGNLRKREKPVMSKPGNASILLKLIAEK